MTTHTTTLRRETFSASAATTLRIDAPHADVTIRHEATDTATIEVSCHDDVSPGPVEMVATGDTIAVRVPPLLVDESGRHGLSVDLGFFSLSIGNTRVRGLAVLAVVPERASLDVDSKSGDVVVAGRSGGAKIRTGSGDIRVEGADAAEAHAGSGDVDFGELGEGSVTTGSGDLTIARLRGPGQLRSGSGDIRVRHASGALTAASASGELTVDLFDGEVLTSRTASGDITVGLPSGVAVWQDVQSVSGDVESLLLPVGQPGEGESFITVRASTASGDIKLRNA